MRIVTCNGWSLLLPLSIVSLFVPGVHAAGLVASATQLVLYDKYGDNMEGCEMYEEGCLLPVP